MNVSVTRLRNLLGDQALRILELETALEARLAADEQEPCDENGPISLDAHRAPPAEGPPAA